MPSTRTNDPETSHLAERSVVSLREKQEAVLEVLQSFGPMTDQQLERIYAAALAENLVPKQSPSGLRTRRNELVTAGLVEPTDRIKGDTNRLCYVWGAK